MGADKLNIATGNKDLRDGGGRNQRDKDSQAHESHRDIFPPGAHQKGISGIITLKWKGGI